MSDDRFAAQRTQITRVGRLRAALMMTDIVGYSRRMHADEARALEDLARHNEIVRAELESHRGREVKNIGDAFLAEFAVADDALRCAVAIQHRIADSFLGADPLRLRIGLHLAEVEAIGPDLIGDGVNILARIEPQAEPGGICASREFTEGLAAPAIELSPLGPVEVKNIARPIELFAWPKPTERAEEHTDLGEERLAETRFIRSPKSIAKLPAAPAAYSPDEGATVVHAGREPAFVPAAFSADETPTTVGKPEPVVPFSAARPLSRSSGIFVAPLSESEPTVARGQPGLGNDGPYARGNQTTLDAPDRDEPEDTGSLPPARLGRDEPSLSGITLGDDPEPSDPNLPRVIMPPPHRPRSPMALIAAVAGLVGALSIAGIVLMVVRAQKKAPPQTTVVNVPAPVAPPAPAPVVAQPAPVAAPPAPAPPATAPVAPPAPAPAPKATLAEQLAHARANIQNSHLKPKQKKALLADLSKLDKKFLKAKPGKPKREAEAALRNYIKKHKLL